MLLSLCRQSQREKAHARAAGGGGRGFEVVERVRPLSSSRGVLRGAETVPLGGGLGGGGGGDHFTVHNPLNPEPAIDVQIEDGAAAAGAEAWASLESRGRMKKHNPKAAVPVSGTKVVGARAVWEETTLTPESPASGEMITPELFAQYWESLAQTGTFALSVCLF